MQIIKRIFYLVFTKHYLPLFKIIRYDEDNDRGQCARID